MMTTNKLKGWIVYGMPLASFAVGSLITAHFAHANEVRGDSNRVFELRIYHTVSGKVPALEARFRDASKLLTQHNINVLGYWVPNDNKPAWENTFVYLIAAPNREEAKKNWDAFHADPEFQKYVKSEEAEKLIDKVDSTYMRPTDFSPMQ
jgi:hypothetical protein